MRRSRKRSALCSACASLSLAALAAGEPDVSGLALEHVAAIALPTSLTHAPEDSERLFVTELYGQIFVVRGSLATVYLDLTDVVVRAGEGGMLGLPFDPDFATNATLYACYTTQDDLGTNRWLVEAIRVDDPDADAPQIVERAPVFTQVDGAGRGRQGGWIGFAPDGMLLIGLGDTGRPASAQDLTDPRGKVLRIDVRADDFPADPDQNYAVPPDNPFAGVPGAEGSILAYGLRNPYRCSVDPVTGDVWVANVGGPLPGELHLIPAGSGGGQNFGWSCFEGGVCLNSVGCPEDGCADPAVLLPVASVPREDGRCALTGVEVYRGSAMPQLRGTVLFTDYCGLAIEAVDPADGSIARGPSAGQLIVSLGRDADGELYVLDRDAVKRVVPADGGCPGDWNADTFFNDQDFFEFINDFFGGAGPRGHADFNRDGFQNDQDFFDFINAFFVPGPGCAS